MKRFALASLTALAASQAAGCIIEGGSEDAVIGAVWQMRSEVEQKAVSCPPDSDTAVLWNQEVDPNGNPIGQKYKDIFFCADGAGNSQPLKPALYQTWIEITDHSTSVVYAKSLSAFIDVIDEDMTFNTQILVDGGYFQLAWGLQDAATNAPLSCADAQATGVESIGALVSNPNVANSDVFKCGDKYGVTAGYTTGQYTVSVHALGAGDAQIGDSVVLSNKAIEAPNKVTNLGTLMLPVD